MIAACGHRHGGIRREATQWPDIECQGGTEPVPVVIAHPSGWYMPIPAQPPMESSQLACQEGAFKATGSGFRVPPEIEPAQPREDKASPAKRALLVAACIVIGWSALFGVARLIWEITAPMRG